MIEPTSEVFHRRTLGNRLFTWIAATRPAFLTASVLPVVVALALSRQLTAHLDVLLAILTLLAIILIHSGANVLNDYFDALNGTDDANQARVYPFTGGSRFIQNAVLDREETRRFGFGLIAAGAALGLLISALSGPPLLAIGLLGGLIAIFYSAPPCLACRGLGDAAILVCFGLLPVIGTAYIQTGAFPVEAWWVGLSVGSFIAAILWANSIPDIAADRRANKLTLPARLGERRARYGLPALFGLGFGLLVFAPLPAWSLIALLAAIPGALAVMQLFKGRLARALPLTIMTHAVFAILLTLGLVVAH
ncbi:MAG: prenyltransferase [Thiotrichales bacterium]